MIETNMQPQQQDTISQQQLSHPHPDPRAETVAGTGPTITCSICDAVYAPSLQQAPFLQYAQRALEATFMGMCHFCFRCRRAACPQCWDEVHGVCGSCVQEAGLPFRIAATPFDGLVFPPTAQAPSMPSQPQNGSLLVPLRDGRFHSDLPAMPEPARANITTEHTPAIQSQPAVALSEKTSLPEDSQDTREQAETPRIAKKVRKASRLEQTLTWIVLVIVLALVIVIVLAEFIPAVNAPIARVTHIDIHGEIAYLVHIVQQFFKK